MATVEQFQYWQDEGAWHPLTCGNDSNHALLVPSDADVEGGILLTCPDCDYRQIPADYLHGIAEHMRELPFVRRKSELDTPCDNGLQGDDRPALVVAVAPPVGALPRCLRCGGTIYASSHTEEDEMGHTSFVGFELTCMLCARVAGYISIQQLALFYDVPLDDILRARFATMAFFGVRGT